MVTSRRRFLSDSARLGAVSLLGCSALDRLCWGLGDPPHSGRFRGGLYLGQSPLTRRSVPRRMAADLLPKLFGPDTTRERVEVLFDLLRDGDGKVRVPVADALTRATQISGRQDLDFWRTASQAERDKVRKGWVARWRNRG